MKNRLTLYFLLLFVAGYSQDPPLSIAWDKLYAGSSTNHYGKVVRADKFSGVYTWGDANPSGTYLRKYLKKDGTVLWTVTKTNVITAFDATLVKDTSIAVCGEYVNGSERDYWVMLVGQSGTIIWERTYDGTSATGDDDYGTKILADAFGNIYITGRTNDGSGNPADHTDMTTLKYDYQGNLLWAKDHNGPGNDDDEGADIALDDNLNVYVAGWEYVDPIKTNNMFIQQYRADGTPGWSYSYDRNPTGSLHTDMGFEVEVEGTKVYLSGMTESSGGGADQTVFRFDTAGTVIWLKHFDLGMEGYVQDMLVDHDKNLVALGSTDTSAWVNSGGYLVVKYDSLGNTLWYRPHWRGPNYGGGGFDMAIDASNNIYLTGGVGGATEDLYVESLFSADGNLRWATTYTATGTFYREGGRSIDVDTAAEALYVTGYRETSSVGYRVATIKWCGALDHCFFPDTTLYTASDRYGTMGDFNGDSYPDIANTNTNPAELRLYLNNKNGIVDTSAVKFPTSVIAYQLGARDLNSDGFDDIVLYGFSSDTVEILLNDTIGGFLPGQKYFVGQYPYNIDFGDIDNNGTMDILVFKGNVVPRHLVAMLNNGNGQFTTVFTVASAAADVVRLGDFDNDNVLDAVTGSVSANNVQYYKGNGNGTFSFISAATTVRMDVLKVYDLNGDGNLDFIGGTGTGSGIYYYYGNGNGTFGTINSITTSGVLGTINILPVMKGVSGYGIWAGHGTSAVLYGYSKCGEAFTAINTENLGSSNYPRGAYCVDMDKNGMPDRVMIYTTPARIKIWLDCDADTSAPASGFSMGGGILCDGVPIQFTDTSGHNPNSWNWIFPGGSPSSSTLQNPVITYTAAGTYTVTLTANNMYGIGSTFAQVVTINSCSSGAAEAGNTNNIRIIPNPSSGLFAVSSSLRILAVEIVNGLGEKIYENKPGDKGIEINIDLRNQPPGIYLIKVNSEKGVVTKKIVLQ